MATKISPTAARAELARRKANRSRQTGEPFVLAKNEAARRATAADLKAIADTAKPRRVRKAGSGKAVGAHDAPPSPAPEAEPEATPEPEPEPEPEAPSNAEAAAYAAALAEPGTPEWSQHYRAYCEAMAALA